MNRKEFFRQLSKNGIDQRDVVTAYWLAKETHRRQLRDAGERYFEHVRRVASYLLRLGGSNATEINIALLHDCDEDGFLPQYILERIFGAEVALSVGLLSKTVPTFDPLTGSITDRCKKDLDAYFGAIRNGPRPVRRIKVADRIDNASDMAIWPKERKQKYLLETEKYVLPIAKETDQGMFDTLETLCEGLRKELAE